MAKKTSVILPNGIAGLVHQAQGMGEPARKNNDKEGTSSSRVGEGASDKSAAPASSVETAKKTTGKNQAPSSKAAAESKPANSPAESNAVNNGDDYERTGRPGRPAKKPSNETPTERAVQEYKSIKDRGGDSWELFMELGKIYKSRDSKLTTIYIDNDLKKVLDRLKTASDVKLPTAAILSSIVARFIFDHKEKINEVIFGERLI